jgi:hypothetical protein
MPPDFKPTDGSQPSRWRWTRDEWDALGFFRLLATHRVGYDLCGVRGWAHINDVQHEVRGSSFAEVLPRLHKRGHLIHADVRAPGQQRPVWVYRISGRGLAVMDEAAPKEHKPVSWPRTEDTGGAVYAPSRQRGALRMLREAYDDPRVPERFGGRGWVSGRELGARVDLHNFEQRRRRGRRHPYVSVDGTDLHWLVLWRFVERQNDPEGAVDVYWRVTEAGRAVRLLDWKPLRAYD